MPRDAAGTYTLPGAYNPVVIGEFVTAEWANTTLADIASCITDSLSRSGIGGMLATLRFADGSLIAPGMAFTNESTSGIARLSDHNVSTIVLGIEALRVGADRITFLLPPLWSGTPTDTTHLVPKGYVDTTFAPLAGPTFTAAPSWVGTPTLAAHLAPKSYVDSLAFSTALPGLSLAPRGSVVRINEADGAPGWSIESAEIEALAIIASMGA